MASTVGLADQQSHSTMSPVLYIGHGAPPLLDDPVWFSELANLAQQFKKPQAILIVSAHWEAAPLMVTSLSTSAPLIYDFGGFHPKYYQLQYQTPDASTFGTLLSKVLPDHVSVTEVSNRGLDHGAYIPLMAMYPDADIPVIQMSIPTHDPETLLTLGKSLRVLREHGVLIIGSGFLTHGLPFLKEFRIEASPPTWSVEFDAWAREAIARHDIDSLMKFKELAPGMPYAHPTVEHLTPLFVALGASTDLNVTPETVIDGFWMGLAKTSFQVA